MNVVPAGFREILIHPVWILPNLISTEHFRLVQVVNRSQIPGPLMGQIGGATYLFMSRDESSGVIAIPPLWRSSQNSIPESSVMIDDGYPVGMPDPDLWVVFANRIPPFFPELGVISEIKARVAITPRPPITGQHRPPSYGDFVRASARIIFDEGYPVSAP